MSRRRKIIRILGVIIAVIGIVICLLNSYDAQKENKAIQLAQDYLNQKYDQDMIYESVRYSWVEPGQYHVYFTSVETEVWFGVSMWPRALECSEVPPDEYIWDNYLESFFCRRSEEILFPEVENIWDENVSIQVSLITNNAYPSRGAEEPNEKMTVAEMEPLYNYKFIINTHRLLNHESAKTEAERLFDMIQYIKTIQYEPREITIWYQTGKDEKDRILTNSDTWSEYYIKFVNYENIYSLEQIIEIMNEYWTFES